MDEGFSIRVYSMNTLYSKVGKGNDCLRSRSIKERGNREGGRNMGVLRSGTL